MENRFGTFGDNDPAKGLTFNQRISDIGNEFIEEYNGHVAAMAAAVNAIDTAKINQNRKIRMGGM